MGISIKAGQSAVTGYVGGVWDKDSKSFKIKRGKTKTDKKYQVFSVKVSSKDKDSGKYTNGKDIEVMMFGDTKIEDGTLVGLIGKFVPNNYETKEGKEVRGNQFMAFDTDMFTPDSWEKKESTPAKKPEPIEVEDEEAPW